MGQSFVQLNADGAGKKADTVVTATTAQHRSVVAIGDSSVDAAVSNVFQFHNTDNQSLGGSAYGVNTGGVAQLLNQAGNLDRQRETGIDSVAAVGVQAGASQFAQGFLTTDTTDTFTAGTRTFTPVAMSGLLNGAAWSIQVGSILTLDISTNAEVVLVTAVASTTFTCVTTKTHTAPFNITGYVYNQERDASGELDGATGTGMNVAAEYEFNGQSYDRGRNIVGKGIGSTTTTATVSSSATTATASATPTGLQSGQPLFFVNTTTNAITEMVYMAKNYTAGSTSLIFSATTLTHTSGTDNTIQWDILVFGGSAANRTLPTGLGAEADYIWDATNNGAYMSQGYKGVESSNMDPQPKGGFTTLAIYGTLPSAATTWTSTPGKFAAWSLLNTTTAPVFLEIFDTTGAVTLGTTVPSQIIPLPSNTTASNGSGANMELTNGAKISNGMKYIFVTAPNGATAVTTGVSGSIWGV